MQRKGMMIRLQPGCAERYRELHQAVWPEVLQKIKECHIRNYSIYCKDDWIFSYFEYHGDDFAADMDLMAADPKTQEWWALTKPLQQPQPTRNEGDWWSMLDEVFHLDG